MARSPAEFEWIRAQTATDRPYAEGWMTHDEQRGDTERGEDSVALHAAAETLRARIPPYPPPEPRTDDDV